MSNIYTTNEIRHLGFFDHVRHYPGMYIGSKDLNGLHHMAKEIISNSIDEYLNGAGTEIDVIITKDDSLIVRDNARGIPLGQAPDQSIGVTALQACFGVENTGGKFNNATGETGYNTSGGEHGVGAKAVNALSTKLIVTSEREGKYETVEFSKGKFIRRKTGKSSRHGLTVQFYPDAEVLETIHFDYQKLANQLREFSFLDSGLTFNLIDEKINKKETFYSENGLYDFINYLNQGKSNFITNPIYFLQKEQTYQVEAIIGYNNSFGNTTKLFTNNIPQEKGTHLTGFKTAFTSCLNQFAKNKKWLKEKDANLTGSDYDEGQILILNFRMIDPVFKGQNKEELSSSEGRTYTQKLTTLALNEYMPAHEKDIKLIFDKAIAARKAKEAAKKARDKVREGNKKKQKALKFDSKLADCNSKDRSQCEIYVTEGDSASGNLKLARNNATQAVMPVRGKILNTEKATLSKITKNAEIMTMLDAFFGPGGWTMDSKTLKVNYDKVRYGKIIIMSDADVDGAHIKNLFYTFIWNMCPDLIRNGYIYAGVPPLYRIVFSNGESIYLKNDDALDDWRKAYHGNRKYELKRMKGLGEMDVDETESTLTDPNNRIIKQITISDIQKTDKLFNDLMGMAIVPRKEFIKKYSAEAGEYNGE